MKITVVDPPSGWQYGFPQPLEEDYRAQLERAGYEGEDLEFALRYSRYWTEPAGCKDCPEMNAHDMYMCFEHKCKHGKV